VRNTSLSTHQDESTSPGSRGPAKSYRRVRRLPTPAAQNHETETAGSQELFGTYHRLEFTVRPDEKRA
jgi:hypothetical protein